MPPTSNSTPSPFSELGLSPELCEAVRQAGYTEPTPIQLGAIPPVLKGGDLLGHAQTGTGKTAAFALPILQRLNATRGNGKARALVLAPTRELAIQIADSFETYGGRRGPRTMVICGGVNEAGQIRTLRRGVDVIVATPGRLLALARSGDAILNQVEVFVLDEADHLLDMGFLPDVRRIDAFVPEKRQTLLFSATMPEAIGGLATKILHNPTRIAVDPVSSTRGPIEQTVFHVEQAKKPALLIKLIERANIDRALVFTRTKHGANRLVEKLDKGGVEAAALHGNKSQSARQRALNAFKTGALRIIVATDIAARGIDVKGVSHVFNYDLPSEAECYVHRIGRTGRAGASGSAMTLCTREELGMLRTIERITGQPIECGAGPEGLTLTPPPANATPPRAAPRQRQERGGRPGGNRGRPGGGNARRGNGGQERSDGGNRSGNRSAAGNRSPSGNRSAPGDRSASGNRNAPGSHNAAGDSGQRRARPQGDRRPGTASRPAPSGGRGRRTQSSGRPR